jgi:hypothetical protein
LFECLEDRRFLKVWWALAWRSLVMIFAAMLAGGVIGFVIGFILALLGLPLLAIKIFTSIVTFPIGVILGMIPLYKLLDQDLGGIKLSIVSVKPARKARPKPKTVKRPA